MALVFSSSREAPPALPINWFSTRSQIVAAACTCTGASAFIYAVDPNRHAVYPQCFLYNLTGIYCAGCGATRALYALLHARILDALHDNALFVLALPLVFYVAGSYSIKAWQSNAWPDIHIDRRKLTIQGIGLFAVLLGFMIARNLPGWPFDWLKPLVG